MSGGFLLSYGDLSKRILPNNNHLKWKIYRFCYLFDVVVTDGWFVHPVSLHSELSPVPVANVPYIKSAGWQIPDNFIPLLILITFSDSSLDPKRILFSWVEKAVSFLKFHNCSIIYQSLKSVSKLPFCIKTKSSVSDHDQDPYWTCIQWLSGSEYGSGFTQLKIGKEIRYDKGTIVKTQC